MHLTSEQLKTLKAKLVEQEGKLRALSVSLSKTNPAEDTERGNENADAGDDATESRELERHASLIKETDNMLLRVEEALARMEDGSYGHTIEGKEIPYARLLIDPTVTTLVSLK